MTDKDKSILALNQFKSALKRKEKYGNDGFKFQGIVIYDALDKIVTENVECILIVGGIQPEFRINTDDSGKLITEDVYHLDFKPFCSKNTTFTYIDSDETFIINGNSTKLGNYKVTISEI